jgi:uncharacterized protein (TIGR03435 family)
MRSLACLFAMVTLPALQSVAPFGFILAQPSASPSFEVASIRQRLLPPGVFLQRPWSPAIQCPEGLRCGISGNRFDDEAASLRDLIVDAYAVQTFRILGLPAWGSPGGNLYDVHAKVAGDSVATLDQVRPMLQTLLADRFHLRIHHEVRELPVYALVPGKHKSRLVPRPENGCTPRRKHAPANTASAPWTDDPEAFRQFWAKEDEFLTVFADRPVIDKSGLNGLAYCTIDGRDPLDAIETAVYGPGGTGRIGPGRPDLATIHASISPAIEEAWGMKLEPQKAPVDVLVIDSVERPSGN